MVEYVEMVTGNEDAIKERNWGVGRIICITVEVTETREERPGARWLNTFTTLCHDHQPLPQMNPGALTGHPVSKPQSEYSAQNSCHDWVMSGNVVPILALSCTSILMTWPYISLHWIQVQTTFPHFWIRLFIFLFASQKGCEGSLYTPLPISMRSLRHRLPDEFF